MIVIKSSSQLSQMKPFHASISHVFVKFFVFVFGQVLPPHLSIKCLNCHKSLGVSYKMSFGQVMSTMTIDASVLGKYT